MFDLEEELWMNKLNLNFTISNNISSKIIMEALNFTF
jgi:hypothetical protein